MASSEQTQSLEALLSGLSRYTIQNLTINSYGPLTVMGGAPTASVSSASAHSTVEVPSSDEIPNPITPQWDWATANVRLQNNLEGTLRRVTVYHRRGWAANYVTEKTWENLNPGNTSDVFRTDFQSGFNSDYDYWRIAIQLEDGGPTFTNDGWKQCNLRGVDEDSKGDLVFTVSGETFGINLRSGGDSTSLRAGTPGLNGFAWLQVQNNFDAPIRNIELRHSHEGFPARTRTWQGPISPGSNSESWPVYFQTGNTSNDNWDIAVLREGDKKPHLNQKKDKGCWLQGADNGRAVKIIVRNDGWTMDFPSGSCADYWDWRPNLMARRKALPVPIEGAKADKLMKKVSELGEEEWVDM